MIHPVDRTMMAAYLAEEVVGQKKAFDKEYRIVRQMDWAERWVHGTGKLVFDSQGKPVKMHGVIRDITEQKLAEAQLRNSEMRYRETFEQAAVGIVHLSFDGTYKRCNPSFAKIIGYLAQEIPGLTFRQITSPLDLAKGENICKQLLNGSIDHASWEKRFIRKDGSITWVRITTSMQRDGEERPLHFIQFVEDINSRKLAEQRLTTTQTALRASEARYRITFEMCLDAITITRLSDGVCLDCNKAFLSTVGHERQEVIGQSMLELGIWTDIDERKKLLEALRLNGFFSNLEVQFQKKSGELFWGLMSASTIELDGVPCVLAVTKDISEIKATAECLAESMEAHRVSEEHYRTVFKTSLDAIAITHLSDGRCVDVNRGFLDCFGYERGDVMGRTTRDIGIWAESGDRQILTELLGQQSQCRNLEAKFRKKSGEVISGLISASVIELDGVSCILSFMRDISDLKDAEEKIRDLAFYDPLTGLPNRRLLLDRLQHSLATGARTGRKRALFFIDLDNFKNLNDTLGHHTGDLLLQEVARRLASCVREADTVARLGGDEFVVLLEELSNIPEEAAAQVEAIGKKILEAMDHPFWLEGRECRSTSSIGVKLFGDRAESATDIMQHADIALYQAKAAGRNAMRFYAPALQAAINARASMETDLRHAIKGNEFELYYQPQVDSTGLIGAEALIRWNHPRSGILAPDEFIPLAEETGLILPLGDWVLETACKQIAAWAEQKETAHLSVAVNISARQFRQPDFVHRVLAVLDRTGANPQRLKLELTESMLLENIEDVIARMTVLKSHHLEFALDDFGTCYSSLAYLRRLPLDQLKIDRSFVWDMLTDASNGAIVQAIISMGRAMGLLVTAEGVETEEQRDYLLQLGCHSFQGYLFGRPRPLGEFQLQPCIPGRCCCGDQDAANLTLKWDK